VELLPLIKLPPYIVCRLQHTPGWETHSFRTIIEWSVWMDLRTMWENTTARDDPDREARRGCYGANREAGGQPGAPKTFTADYRAPC
jgi:hypothetical protein